MKSVFIVLLFWLTSAVNAQSFKLNFEPEGRVLELKYDSLTFYTDTTALFEAYRKEGTLKEYDKRVFNFVRKEINTSQNDTVTFSGDFIPFNDGVTLHEQDTFTIN